MTLLEANGFLKCIDIMIHLHGYRHMKGTASAVSFLFHIKCVNRNLLMEGETTMKKLNNENTYAILEVGETYQFAGYNWTVCKLINDGRTAVIQSHGVTHGPWPGFKLKKFGNGNYYATDIADEDISAYDDKTQSLYDNIKDVEDKSASYGSGLYLISKEKAGFTKWGNPGSGYYWTELKAVAENASSFGDASLSNAAWFGSAYGSTYAWYVYSDGSIYYSTDQGISDYVVAPAFNLDLSKVEIKGDEIIKKSKFDFASMALTTPSDNNLSANSDHASMSAASDNTPKKMDL